MISPNEFAYLLPTVTLSLPATIPAVVGHELNIYFENIINTKTPTPLLTFDVSTTDGTTWPYMHGGAWDEKWTYLPLVGDIGSHPLTITVSYQGIPVVSGTTTILVLPATAASPVSRKIFLVGDSLSEDGSSLAELTNLCNYNHASPSGGNTPDNLTITTIGRKTVTVADSGGTNRTVNHEATGGWSANLYWLNTGSPFYFNGVFDFPTYCSTYGITFAVDDWIVFELGVNDAFFATSEANAQTNISLCLAALDGMIANMKLVQSGVRFAICLPIPPATPQDPFGKQYGMTSASRLDHKRWVTSLQQAMVSHYGQSGANNIWICPFHVNIDTVWDMQVTAEYASARNSQIVGRITNALHPGPSGHWHMADSLYAFLRSRES